MKKRSKKKGGEAEATEEVDASKSGTAAKVKDIKGGTFKKVDFSDRKRSAEELAVEQGEKLNGFNQKILVGFGALSGIILLVISGFMSYLEALNAANIIDLAYQFEKSLGLSSMSALFSVIGFQQAARWWKYRSVAVTLPVLLKDKWGARDESKTMYAIMETVVVEKRGYSGFLAILFILFNFVTSAITYIAVVSAMPPTAQPAEWIYTVAITFMCFVSGAGISLLTSPDVSEMTVISETLKRYDDYASAQSAADSILNGKK